MSEFGLIKRYFTRPSPGAELGVGDDAALLRVSPGMELAVSTDMLVSGTHFFPDDDPFLLGGKALAVNLSDMAAMGAVPRWALLSLSLPAENAQWLQPFSEGFFAQAQQHAVDLVGGDTTRGPLNICVTIMGEAPQDAALRRSGAQAGDDIWVSGRLGDAALALAHLEGRLKLAGPALEECLRALRQPQPRIELGLALRGLATSSIDISDGLLADLGHILECSGAGALIDLGSVPFSLLLHAKLNSMAERDLALHCVLSGGDDYELCFTVPAARRGDIEDISTSLGLPLARIGAIVPESGLTVIASDGSIIRTGETGYDHFA